MAKLTDSYNLQKINPRLSKEWHPTQNGTLTPKDVTPFSYRKVWWICNKKHEWLTSISHRSKGSGCPYCSGRTACDDNCLQTLKPELAKEWHLRKNYNLTPKDVTLSSNKKVWWICGKDHEWVAMIRSRSNGSGCPFCAGQRATKKNCLRTINPALAKQWHPTQNGKLTPKDVTAQSHQKVWWVCSKGHEWEAKIYSRKRSKACPYCSGRKACSDNCLQTVNPMLAKEWHPSKNGHLSPKDVRPKSGKKVWWLCKKGHEWQAQISNRSNNSGCPYCRGRKLSEDNCLQTANPHLAKEWHPTKNGKLTPMDILPGSNKKAWWTCSRGHEWKTSIYNRNRGSGCPHCAKLKTSVRNRLRMANRKVSKEYSI